MAYQIEMTEERKKMFRDMGHEEGDMRQLSKALKRTKYKVSSREEGRTTPISAVQALEILGEKKILIRYIQKCLPLYSSKRDRGR